MSNVVAGKVPLATVQSADQHLEAVDVTTTKRPHVLMVVANPTTATTTGWPVGEVAGAVPVSVRKSLST